MWQKVLKSKYEPVSNLYILGHQMVYSQSGQQWDTSNTSEEFSIIKQTMEELYDKMGMSELLKPSGSTFNSRISNSGDLNNIVFNIPDFTIHFNLNINFMSVEIDIFHEEGKRAHRSPSGNKGGPIHLNNLDFYFYKNKIWNTGQTTNVQKTVAEIYDWIEEQITTELTYGDE
tara:strand:+ start:552 stop:1070 length:519 start_codon:yes stop_codon:yes gene_type:complete